MTRFERRQDSETTDGSRPWVLISGACRASALHTPKRWLARSIAKTERLDISENLNKPCVLWLDLASVRFGTKVAAVRIGSCRSWKNTCCYHCSASRRMWMRYAPEF